MTTPLFVPDASVILKWAFQSPDEQDCDKALDLLGRWLAGSCSIILPSLWIYECGNVLGLKALDTAAEIMDIFIGYRFDECPLSTAITGATLQLMRDYQVTFYDAVYHVVAMNTGAMLVTADAAYFRKTNQLGKIIMLENFV
jgi:predicted nucleic acid-binding protein